MKNEPLSDDQIDQIAEQLAIRLSAEEAPRRAKVLKAFAAKTRDQLKDIEAAAEAHLEAISDRT